MIIKGKSRGGAKQLAGYLLRVGKNEQVQMLELKSPAPTLAEALREWQVLAEGTKGSKGLYHAQINPEARYAMTPDQWKIAADRLEKELGLEGQPRTIVLHDKQGRQHAHVVWQRTDIDTMTLVSDSNNYYAHERASLALEKEFGHELVPGKHVKRDPQQEAQKVEVTEAENKQAERLGLDIESFREAITAIYQHCDTGQALHAALAERGLTVAKGDRRDFVIVDGAGEVYSLARQISGMKTKELRAFMADVDAATVPTVEEARATLRAKEPTVEVPAPAEPAHEKEPEIAPPETPTPSEQPKDDPEIVKLKAALAARHENELRKWREFHAFERKQTEYVFELELKEKMDVFDAAQERVLAEYDEARAAERRGLKGFIAAIRARLNPTVAAEETKARQQERWDLINRLAKEREGELALRETVVTDQLAELAEKHAQQVRDAEGRYEEDLARHLRDRAEAERLLARMEQQQRIDEQLQQQLRHGPEPPGAR